MELERFFAYDSFRPGQKELATQVYRQCTGRGTILVEAMSGFGKTAAVLCGAIAAAEENSCRIVYACRTKRQIRRVVQELSELQKKLPLKAASLHSKFDYCLLKRGVTYAITRESFGWYCGFNVSNNLCSYFLNVALLGQDLDTVVRSIGRRVPEHRELLLKAESIHACPYELIRLSAQEATVLVVPYQYALDPGKLALPGWAEAEQPKTILVIDEAHNLRDFFREARSGRISFWELDEAIREADTMMLEEVASALRTLKAEMEAATGAVTGWYVDRESLIRKIARDQGDVWLQNLAFVLNSGSEAAWNSITYERKLPSAMLRVGSFLLKLTSSEDGVLAKWDDVLGLIAPDPVKPLKGFLDGFRSSVLLSATINPSSIFVRSLGLDATRLNIYQSETESLVKVLTIIDTGVTTRYKRRDPAMFSRIAKKVSWVADAVDGATGVFLPSYAVLEPVSEVVARMLPHKRPVAEFRGMSTEEASDAVASLSSDSILFAVQGGRFAEGEDFRGDTMDAVVVAGLSFPPPSPMLYAEYASLKKAGETDSFLMIGRLPALRKAFQSAGRHVREPGKRAVVALLDERFNSPQVLELMPSWLKTDVRVGDFGPDEIRSLVDAFLRPSRLR
ncbi:MAG: ATP-dependent DNA helicase [Nitrososphaerota archaeon]|nr:ATP-dependent DNA helicase [Nitrososphaerota archaeon]